MIKQYLSKEIQDFSPSVTDSLGALGLGMVDALKKVVDAHNTLEALREQQVNKKCWGRVGDLASFSKELADFISCDHGEAGFMPYIEKLVSVIKQDRSA